MINNILLEIQKKFPRYQKVHLKNGNWKLGLPDALRFFISTPLSFMPFISLVVKFFFNYDYKIDKSFALFFFRSLWVGNVFLQFYFYDGTKPFKLIDSTKLKLILTRALPLKQSIYVSSTQFLSFKLHFIKIYIHAKNKWFALFINQSPFGLNLIQHTNTFYMHFT